MQKENYSLQDIQETISSLKKREMPKDEAVNYIMALLYEERDTLIISNKLAELSEKNPEAFESFKEYREKDIPIRNLIFKGIFGYIYHYDRYRGAFIPKIQDKSKQIGLKTLFPECYSKEGIFIPAEILLEKTKIIKIEQKSIETEKE